MVSWAKYGTSFQVFPSLSTTDSIDIILLSNNVNVLNLSVDPILNVWVFISPEIAFVDFLIKNILDFVNYQIDIHLHLWDRMKKKIQN